MSQNLVPSSDLVQSVASRVVTLDVVDMQEGAPADGSVTFTLPCDLHVAADDKIIQAGSRTVTLVGGKGSIRLPTYDPDAAPSSWVIWVKKSWAPYPYPIRIPEGTTPISLADIGAVLPLSTYESKYALSNFNVTVKEGSAWGATGSVAGGNLELRLTVPPGATAPTMIPAGADLNNYKTGGDYWANITAASLLNSPSEYAQTIRVRTTGTGVVQTVEAVRNTTEMGIRTYQRSFWNGVWYAWKEIATTPSKPVELASGADLASLGAGVYNLASWGIANGVVGKLAPLPVVAGAFIEVFQAAGGNKIVRLSSHAAPQQVWQTELDGTKWTAWHRMDSDGAGLSAEWARRTINTLTGSLITVNPTGELPASAWSAPAARTHLAIPTPDGSEQATHPTVIDTVTGWGGHRYWMAYTPYTYAVDATEDPCVAWSDDGTKWTKASASSFPLDDQPGGSSFNSDPTMVISNGTAYVMWRTTDTTTTLYLSTSTDGVTWTPKQAVHTTSDTLFSPALIKTSSGWSMWYVGSNALGRRILRCDTTASLPTNWGAPVECTAKLPAGRDPWHLDVKQWGGRFVGLLTDTEAGRNGVNCALYYMQSRDGVAWEVGVTEVVPAVGPEHRTLYRSSLVPSGDTNSPTIDMWYSGLDERKGWWIYRTTATPAAIGAATSGIAKTAVVDVAPSAYVKATPAYDIKLMVSAQGMATLSFSGTMAAMASWQEFCAIPAQYRPAVDVQFVASTGAASLRGTIHAANGKACTRVSVTDGTWVTFSVTWAVA